MKRRTKLSIRREWRELHNGIGFARGCGHIIRVRYFVILWNGVRKYGQVIGYDDQRP